jgi:hypothetical protein
MNIESIAAKAAQVGSEFQTSVAARAERDKAEAELLEAVVEKVRPALRAISSRIKKSNRTWWPDNVSTASEHSHFEERGLLVHGDAHPECDHPRANRGSYEGGGLWLLTDGTFASVVYEGSWSRWQGEGESWTAELTPLTALEVAEGYDVDGVVAAISTAIDKQAGSREKPIKAATERAEKVRAVTSLLRGGK